ncbi:MAG: hypothetical protein ACLQBX_12200 [Candidatus Limnocylindrales bacterium]
MATLTPPNYPHVQYGRWTAYQRMYFTPDCVGKSVCKLEFEMAMPGQTSGFKRDELAFRAAATIRWPSPRQEAPGPTSS